MVLRTGSCLVDSAPGGARRSRPADWRCRAGAAFLVRFAASDDSRTALGGSGGLHVPESLHLDVPIADVYLFGRRLGNLPSCMAHLAEVTEHDGTNRSHWDWVAHENKTLGWRSLPGADVVTAASVKFRPARGVRITQSHGPPAIRSPRWGCRGLHFIASLFGRAPPQTIREDLSRVKRVLEGGTALSDVT